MTENPDWADGDFSFIQISPHLYGEENIYKSKNPEYIPNTPQNTIKRSIRMLHQIILKN